jgi:hypothetical protein
MKVFLVVVLSVPLVLSGCAARLGRLNDNQRAERLARERGRLTELEDPVQRTKSYITISTLLLDFVTGAARDHQTDLMATLLEQYTMAIQSARDTIINSDRDAARNPSGYKDLELALRQHERRLDDIGRTLSPDERANVEAARNVAAMIRGDLIKRIFPQSQVSRSFRLLVT